MGTTYVPTNVTSGFSATTINQNFADIAADLDLKLHRSTILDNVMLNDLDMNQQKVLNVPLPEDGADFDNAVPKKWIIGLINDFIIGENGIPIATTEIYGISQLSTDQEAIDGVDDTTNLTPSNLEPALNFWIPEIINNNPQIIQDIVNEVLANINYVNVGGATGVFKQVNGNNVEYYSLAGINGTTVSLNGDVIEIDGGGGGVGDVTNGQNIGGGTGVFNTKVAGVLRFYSLLGINGTTVNLNGTTIEIDGGGGGGSGDGIIDESLGTNGYVEFGGGGFVFQWGTENVASETVDTIALPIAVSSALNAQATYKSATTGLTDSANAQTPNNTQIQVANGENQSENIFWTHLGVA